MVCDFMSNFTHFGRLWVTLVMAIKLARLSYSLIYFCNRNWNTFLSNLQQHFLAQNWTNIALNLIKNCKNFVKSILTLSSYITYLKAVRSVTRFDGISPIWQNLISLLQYFETFGKNLNLCQFCRQSSKFLLLWMSKLWKIIYPFGHTGYC